MASRELREALEGAANEYHTLVLEMLAGFEQAALRSGRGRVANRSPRELAEALDVLWDDSDTLASVFRVFLHDLVDDLVDELGGGR